MPAGKDYPSSPVMQRKWLAFDKFQSKWVLVANAVACCCKSCCGGSGTHAFASVNQWREVLSTTPVGLERCCFGRSMVLMCPTFYAEGFEQVTGQAAIACSQCSARRGEQTVECHLACWKGSDKVASIRGDCWQHSQTPSYMRGGWIALPRCSDLGGWITCQRWRIPGRSNNHALQPSPLAC